MLKTTNPDINITNMGWTTIVDTLNKLVVHVAFHMTKVNIDAGVTDPDGVPLVWVEGKAVTRVRKMTDEEFMKYTREFGLKMEVDMRVWHNTDKDKPKKKE